MQLKINWFPIQVPKSPIEINALKISERGDFRAYHNVRQYRYQNEWLAAVVSDGNVPPNFGSIDINCDDLPILTSALTMEAFLSYYAQQGFHVERGKGQGTVLRLRQVPALPSTISFYEGMNVKPFNILQDQTTSFGLVIDYTTHQEFTGTLSDDDTQLILAEEGHEVYLRLSDGSHRSGFIKDVQGQYATIERHGEQEAVPLSDLRVRASYRTVGDYNDRLQRGRGRQVIRTLQTESLMLTNAGYMNVNRLTHRYERVATLLGRNRSANISFSLPTLCQSVISLATEPADLEVRK